VPASHLFRDTLVGHVGGWQHLAAARHPAGDRCLCSPPGLRPVTEGPPGRLVPVPRYRMLAISICVPGQATPW